MEIEEIRLIETRSGRFKIQQSGLFYSEAGGYEMEWFDRSEAFLNYDEAVLEYDFWVKNGVPEIIKNDFFGTFFKTPFKKILFKNEIFYKKHRKDFETE
jgi:hypothetical protein